MILSNASESWCDIDPSCTSTELYLDLFGKSPNDSNGTASCAIPFCPHVLSFYIENSSIRVYDVCILFFSLVFLSYLIIRLASTVKKLSGSLPLFRLLYFMIFLVPVMSCIYEIVSLATGYKSWASKILHVLLRGAILMTELSVVVFGLFIKLCGNSVGRLTGTVAGIVGLSIVFTVVEAVMEFSHPFPLPCEDFKFFTHGGMIFLFSTSTVFAMAYAAIFIVYIFGLYRRWNLPSKKSFYRYALFLSLVNIVQAIGSFLWYSGKHHPLSGNAGICLTVITNVVYVVTFAPMVYWIFLSNYFRMNSALKAEDHKKNRINVVSSDIEDTKRRSSSNPLHFGKKKHGLFYDHTQLIAESYDTSGTYGSMDEEIFVRQITPDSI